MLKLTHERSSSQKIVSAWAIIVSFLEIWLKFNKGLLSENVLKEGLNFGQIWASRSYKLGSYKKKNV